MAKCLKKIIRWVYNKVAVKKAIEFVCGEKSLAEKGKKRVFQLVQWLVKLYAFERKYFSLSLEQCDKYNTILDGLSGFMSGDIEGFKAYEKLGTENLLKDFIKNK